MNTWIIYFTSHSSGMVNTLRFLPQQNKLKDSQLSFIAVKEEYAQESGHGQRRNLN